MKWLYRTAGDFEARITILTEQEGGRRTPVFNGIRWDLKFTHYKPDLAFMIWPEFIDDHGDAISKEIPLTGTLDARMHILMETLRDIVRNFGLQIGTEFYCIEGPRKVGKGVVTKLTGLFERNET